MERPPQQPSGSGSPQQFCLRWNNYQSNLTNVFDQLLQSESFVDVTLACDGHSVKAHKMVLSACSPYFQTLFFDNPCQHPIVIMKDIKWPELKAAVEFMYKGEINVSQEQIGPLLKVAESLKIRGLADVNSEHELRPAGLDEASSNLTLSGRSALAKKRRHASAERSPTGNRSPSERDASEERGSPAAASTGHDSHGHATSSSTPRSLGSPSLPSISVTPQINLQELPGLSLPPPAPLPPPSHGGQSAAQAELRMSLSSHHVPSGHVPSPSNHLSAHAVAQQLSIQQQQAAAAAAAVAQHHQQAREQQQQQAQQQQQHLAASLTASQVSSLMDDPEIKPGIAEMIREEERAKLLESSHAWLGASTSSIAASGYYSHLLKLKSPTWSRQDLRDAIEAVVTQRLRFTQASSRYRIPKGTLYDNILGKSRRMAVLEEAGLDGAEEQAVLEFCCDTSVSPYNRRTKRSLAAVLAFVEKLRRQRDASFAFVGLAGFRWWWAFCKKHGIVSLYFNGEAGDASE